MPASEELSLGVTIAILGNVAKERQHIKVPFLILLSAQGLPVTELSPFQSIEMMLRGQLSIRGKK